MDLGLSGKVALVTAASKGLGRAIAAELTPEGGARRDLQPRRRSPRQDRGRDQGGDGRRGETGQGAWRITASEMLLSMALLTQKFGVSRPFLG